MSRFVSHPRWQRLGAINFVFLTHDVVGCLLFLFVRYHYSVAMLELFFAWGDDSLC